PTAWSSAVSRRKRSSRRRGPSVRAASSASTASSRGYSPTSWATPPPRRSSTYFMGYPAAESHVHADELGDTFTDEMIEPINERLGGPDRCPHGWPVDTEFEQDENAELVALGELEVGPNGTIA